MMDFETKRPVEMKNIFLFAFGISPKAFLAKIYSIRMNGQAQRTFGK